MKIELCCKQMKHHFNNDLIWYFKEANEVRITTHAYVGTPGETSETHAIYYCPWCSEKIELVDVKEYKRSKK